MLNIVAGGIREAWVEEGGLGVQRMWEKAACLSDSHRECFLRGFLKQLSRITLRKLQTKPKRLEKT